MLNPESEYGVVLMVATAMGTLCTPSSQICARVLGPAPYGNEHQFPRVSKKGCKDLKDHRVTHKYYYFQRNSAVSSQCYLELEQNFFWDMMPCSLVDDLQLLFRRKLMHASHNLMLVVVSYLERLVHTHQTTLYQPLKD